MYEERELMLWLCSETRLELEEKQRLIEQTGGIKELYMAALKNELGSVFSKRVREVTTDSARSFDPDRVYGSLSRISARFISMADKEYPGRLKEIPCAPMGLFVIGELPNENAPSLAVVGARSCSEYGRSITKSFIKELANGSVQIISGLAMGIDVASHQAALEAGRKTYGVLGNGIGSLYPRENIRVYEKMLSNGGVISEYFIGSMGLKNHFPERNRIIAGLSDGVLVVEARKKSGTMITVNRCLEQGKDVFVIPGRIGDELSEGCLELIKRGAIPISCVDDIAFCFKERFPDYVYYHKDEDEQYSFIIASDEGVENKAKNKKKSYRLSQEENTILSLLDQLPKHFDLIAAEAQLDYFTLCDVLDSLKDKSLISEKEGGYYYRSVSGMEES